MGFKDFFRNSKENGEDLQQTAGTYNNLWNKPEKEYVNGTVNLDQYNEFEEKFKNDKVKRVPTSKDSPIIEKTDASNIHEVDLFGADRNSDEFWNHHGNNKDFYYDMASKIPEVQERLDSGESLDSIKQNPDLRACASGYFEESNLPRVSKYKDTYISEGDGRHRILAAQDLGMDIKVRVNGEYVDNEKEKSEEESEGEDYDCYYGMF